MDTSPSGPSSGPNANAHLFSFDAGSRTSADGLANGIPVLTLPAEYLRGRMGVQFYKSMGMPELVAHNRSVHRLEC